MSVVLPARDDRAVIEGAIESVIAQTREDWELIVVDGASTDATPEIVDAMDDPRVHLLRHEEPRGVAAARNAGIRRARGDLVAFVDADDRWREDKLEQQIAALEAAGPECGLAYCGLRKAEGEPRTRSGASGRVLEDVLHMRVPTYTSTLLVRREALEACGGFDEGLPCFEDWELCLRLAADWTFAFVDEPLVEKGTGGEHVSADPDALARASWRLRQRHELPDETVARLLTDVGRTHCEAGRFAEGRAYLRRSLRRDRWQPMAWLALAAAQPGWSSLYEASMEAVYRPRRLLERLRSRQGGPADDVRAGV